MGLDMYHLKATLNPNDPEAFTFHEDEFDEDVLDGSRFRRFIQMIPDLDYTTRIVILKDREALERIRMEAPQELDEKETVGVLLGDPDKLVARVEEIEKARGLDSASREIWADTRWVHQRGQCFHGHGRSEMSKPLIERRWAIPESVQKEIDRNPPVAHPPVQVIVIRYPVAAPFRGFYADEVGYQRKGMSGKFYKNFGSPSYFFRHSDVERAAGFLDCSGSEESNRERREFFENQFLVGFEEGTSIFYVAC